MASSLQMRWIDRSDDLDNERLDQLADCWIRVSNSGGAVGFPFAPVDEPAVRHAAQALRTSLGTHNRLLIAEEGDALAGWLVLQMNESALTAHWARLARVQTDPQFRGRGYGRAIMSEAVRMAESLGLEQLHIEVRSGQGIEKFYSSLGWRIVGRWPLALRVAPGDNRDEVLMLLELQAR
jgi:GNAT superfamily N-acetyltransferase